MLRIASCLLAVFLGTSALAADPKACLTEGLQLFPLPGAVVPTNSRFILEGIGPDADRVWDLIGATLTLRADDDAVTLHVLKGWRSDQGRAAVILKPRALLKANRTYRLELGKLDRGSLLNAPDGPQWSTGKGSDDKGPRWVEKPNVAEGRYLVAAGSDKKTRKLRFRLGLKEESPSYLVFSIRRARGPLQVQTYFAPVQGSEVWIGHDECSGTFTFDDGRAYRALVEGFDCAGNPAQRLREMEFHAPRPLGGQ
ncbi:MAG: hypothetical protein M3Y59_12615 [Myxococcota bacterium]|nr:hypothetical protein [Myxococcota bacterium]